jgi:hypothetical protein
MKYIYGSIFSVFMLVMVFACIFAYSRRSGSTGLDMSKVQKMRYEAMTDGAP